MTAYAVERDVLVDGSLVRRVVALTTDPTAYPNDVVRPERPGDFDAIVDYSEELAAAIDPDPRTTDRRNAS